MLVTIKGESLLKSVLLGNMFVHFPVVTRDFKLKEPYAFTVPKLTNLAVFILFCKLMF